MTPTGTTWLRGRCEERFVLVEKHLRGFDMAMVESGYRYAELYWAERDGNWEAAEYQVRKLRLAIENGLERRPKRAATAQAFLAGPLVAIEEVVAAREGVGFERRFRELTEGCNVCHQAEQVAFFEVAPPQTRFSPVRRLRNPPSSRTPVREAEDPPQ